MRIGKNPKEPQHANGTDVTT